MTDEQPDRQREDTLRRLLTEAVEPVTPKPGSEARLRARIRASQRSRTRVPLALRWSAAGVSAVAIIVVGAVFAVSHHDAGSSSNSSAEAGPSVAGQPAEGKASGTLQQPNAADLANGAAASAGAAPAAPTREPPSSHGSKAQNGRDSNGSNGSGVTPEASAGPDVDGDGIGDVLRLDRGALVAQLSKDGLQAVALPRPGAGERILSVTHLVTAANVPVPVVFVRLSTSLVAQRDVVVSLVNGRLTLLRFGSDTAVLTVDATHGYACVNAELGISGRPAPYVLAGSQLVASPRLSAVNVAPGKASGC